MNNIQKTAIRLIANAFLYGKEKGNTITGYRFDSSFLTTRGIITIQDLNALQEELNKLGWTFNILTFNDYVIQDKTFLAGMTRLGFGRIKNKNSKQLSLDFLNGLHKSAVAMIEMLLKSNRHVTRYEYISNSESVTELKVSVKDKSIKVMFSSVFVGTEIKPKFYAHITLGTDNTGTTTVKEFEMDMPLIVAKAKECCVWIVNVCAGKKIEDTTCDDDTLFPSEVEKPNFDDMKVMHKKTLKQIVETLNEKFKSDETTSGYTCECTTDINSDELPLIDGLTINTSIKRFWLTCRTITGSLLGKPTTIMKVSFDNTELNKIYFEWELNNSDSSMLTNTCSRIIEVIKNNIEQERSNKEIESCDIEKSDTFNPPTVKIGDTEWMAENLKYDDGEGGIFINSDNGEYYYTWEAVVRVAKKLGWRLTSDEDWNKACEACGGVKDDYCGYSKCSLKEKLNIKLAGYYYNDFRYVGSEGDFWSSEKSIISAWRRCFDTSSSVKKYSNPKIYGFSVRLIKEI